MRRGLVAAAALVWLSTTASAQDVIMRRPLKHTPSTETPSGPTTLQPACGSGTESDFDPSNAQWIVGDWTTGPDNCTQTRDVYCGTYVTCTDASGTITGGIHRLDDQPCLDAAAGLPSVG